MVVNKNIPDRGDLIWIDFGPSKGHEQKGRRPAIILSPKAYNEKVGLALLCPITSKTKNYPFEVPVNGKEIQGIVLSDQVRSFAWPFRNFKKIEVSPNGVLEEVKAKILALIS